jgi:phosphinothricin acetyltransferase
VEDGASGPGRGPDGAIEEAEEEAMTFQVRAMSAADWEGVRAVYLEGMATGNATFETAAPEWERWNAGHRKDCRLVACDDEGVIGFAALSPVSSREVYAGVAEVSLYVAARARGEGVGSHLLKELMRASEEAGVWTLQAGIFPENAASLGLHARFGFRVVGTRERIGQRDGRWRDVVLMERRSATAGV